MTAFCPLIGGPGALPLPLLGSCFGPKCERDQRCSKLDDGWVATVPASGPLAPAAPHYRPPRTMREYSLACPPLQSLRTGGHVTSASASHR
jgi:hypothetical protein